MLKAHKHTFLTFLIGAAPLYAHANPEVSLILDGYHKSQDTELGQRSEGFGLSHSELALKHSWNNLWTAKASITADLREGEAELALEEAYLECLAIFEGASLKAGRFLADIGYLNSQHSHADSFTERPLAYRAFLGNHYYDNGVGLSMLMPTDLFWRISINAFQGERLADTDSNKLVGIWALSNKIGGDLSASTSWQAGISYMRNNTLDFHEHDDEHDDDHHSDHDDDHGDHEEDHHGHSHSAEFVGKNTYIADLVWKWAPQGNNRHQQLTLSGEYFRVTDLNQYSTDDDYHSGYYLSGVYRFLPEWSIGARYGEINVQEAHGDHFHGAKLNESSVMLAWNPTHTQTLRLQYTHQSGDEFEHTDNAITLQYQIGFGDHEAHTF